MFAAKLQLEDATGQLDALLLGRHAEQLLGFPAGNLAENPQHLARLQGMLAQLGHMAPGGVNRFGEGCAWIEVVVSSCYSRAAAAAVADAEEEAAADSSSLGDSLSEEAVQALASPPGCIYLLHDTVLVAPR